jgi:GntR family transcriptional regulator
MASEIDRTPPYLQVVQKLRERILSGELKDGDHVPSVREIAAEWEISQATAMKALATLRADGLVESVVGVGTIVRTKSGLHRNAHDRFLRMLTTGKIYADGEYAKVASAGLAPMTAAVAEAFGLEAGTPGVRRHRVTFSKDDKPISASTSWFTADLAETVPALVSTDRIPGGTPSAIKEATSRVATYSQEMMAADNATPEQAADLQIEVGEAVQLGRNILWDKDGDVIEVGESVHPRQRWTITGEGKLS